MKILLAVVLAVIIIIYLYISFNKQKIIRQVTTEISDQLNGKVTIGNVQLSFLRNFPHISVLLQDVSITDTLFNTHHHTFLKGKEIFVHIDVLRLIKRQPPIRGIKLQAGAFYLYTDSTGYTNTYLLRVKKEAASANKQNQVKTELKDFSLNNTRFIVDDRRKRKFHDLVINELKIKIKANNKGNRLLLATKTNILVKSLAFKTVKGSYVEDKVFRGRFNLWLHKNTKLLSFDSIDIQLSGHPFNLSGQLELAGVQPQFRLRIHTRNISYAFIKSTLPGKLAGSLSIVDVTKPMDVSASIAGPLKGGDPTVYAQWQARNVDLNTLFMDFQQATFRGFFSNEVVAGLPRKDPNSVIEITDFTASWHGLPVRSEKIRILNLSQPLLTCDLTSDFPLTQLNELIGSKTLNLNQGQGTVQLNYKGPLVRNNNTNSFLNGTISFKDAVVEYTPRKAEMKKVNGRLVFKNSDVYVEDLRCEVFNNSITMNGQAKSLLTLINTQPDKANIDWNISIPVMNLGSFLYLFKAKQTHTRKTTKKPRFEAIANKIDDFIERGQLRVHLNAGQLVYKNFVARNALADITLLNDRYIINNVSMDHSTGHIALKGSLLSQSNAHVAHLTVNMDNVDVRKVFADFNNFGQDGITAEHLEGKLFAAIRASMKMTDEGQVIPSSIVSMIDFSLINGALNNYEPIKKLQRFVFKKRDFNNIRFAELKNRLEINNQDIKINRMEIQSTVMSLFVEGIYNKKGTTDLSIQVPLSNLKKRDEDYNPENIGADKKGGGSIFIRGRPGEDGNIKFKLDLFKRYDKDKKTDSLTL